MIKTLLFIKKIIFKFKKKIIIKSLGMDDEVETFKKLSTEEQKTEIKRKTYRAKR